MNQKEFRQNLLRGRGCCVQAVKQDPQRCRKQLLWACTHELAYDPQCEGTRSTYLYRMLECCPDPTPFLDALIGKFQKLQSDGGWMVLYLAEILSCFAMDGSDRAWEALRDKYDQMYRALKGRKRRPRTLTFPLRENFEQLCVVLCWDDENLAAIAQDLGRLFRENSLYDCGDFEWFWSLAKERLDMLREQAEENPDIAYFIQAGEAMAQEYAETDAKRAALRKSWRKVREGDAQEAKHCMEAYLAAREPQERTQALRAFMLSPYPGDPEPILADAQSEDVHLQLAAARALRHIRHPRVRQFAMEHLYDDSESWLEVFLTNYTPEDAACLGEYVLSVPVDFQNTTAWHGDQLALLDMEDKGLEAPSELLRHVYETTYCSCCRFQALKQLDNRGELTPEDLEELQYDSNDDIREYIEKREKA